MAEGRTSYGDEGMVTTVKGETTGSGGYGDALAALLARKMQWMEEDRQRRIALSVPPQVRNRNNVNGGVTLGKAAVRPTGTAGGYSAAARGPAHLPPEALAQRPRYLPFKDPESVSGSNPIGAINPWVNALWSQENFGKTPGGPAYMPTPATSLEPTPSNVSTADRLRMNRGGDQYDAYLAMLAELERKRR